MIEYIECRGTDLNIIGIIRSLQSIVWQIEYTNKGAFEVVVPFTAERFEWLQPDNFITRVDREELGIIESVEIGWEVGKGQTIKASGAFGLTFLDRRVHCFTFGTYRGRTYHIPANQSIENLCRTIVTANLINPSFGRRKVSFIQLGSLSGETTDYSVATLSTYMNALELTRELLVPSPYPSKRFGQRMRFDREQLKLNYEVFNGRQTNIIFSQEYKNLLSFNYSIDKELYKSLFVIAGSGDGKDRFYTYVDREQNVTGLTDREFVYEAEATQTYTDENGTDVTLSNSDYASILKDECIGKFPEHYTAIKVSGNVDLSRLEYGVDYTVGDLVTIRDTLSGIETPARIWSVTESQQEDYQITADFEG
jgi:hypothetical protein